MSHDLISLVGRLCCLHTFARAPPTSRDRGQESCGDYGVRRQASNLWTTHSSARRYALGRRPPPCTDPRYRPWYAAAAAGPKDVVLVVDTSGSMSGEREQMARDAASKAVLSRRHAPPTHPHAPARPPRPPRPPPLQSAAHAAPVPFRGRGAGRRHAHRRGLRHAGKVLVERRGLLGHAHAGDREPRRRHQDLDRRQQSAPVRGLEPAQPIAERFGAVRRSAELLTRLWALLRTGEQSTPRARPTSRRPSQRRGRWSTPPPPPPAATASCSSSPTAVRRPAYVSRT